MKNKQGIVLVTVLMMIIVISVLVISIMNMNLGQLLSSEEQAKQIKAEILAKGMVHYVNANQQSASPSNTISFSRNIDGISYSVTANLTAGSIGIMNETDTVTIGVTY